MIRTGTVRFWDMYWHPAATARAVADAGMRATIGAPLIDGGDGGGRRVRETAASTASRRCDASAPDRVSRALAPHAIYTVERGVAALGRRAAAERELPVQIHLSETEQEVDDCLEAHGVRPAVYLDGSGCSARARCSPTASGSTTPSSS